ncbi:hypothetical protein CEXT_474651 [Caerostris extrusa]|uniref:Uncharacterized protein n=1 Tax=Caerostris extrusa TaxID=172846 RepID=A0AAV4TAF5_CAEEX|nr:hypothetical protein CEXT_474651 [Caerostris extrusa]
MGYVAISHRSVPSQNGMKIHPKQHLHRPPISHFLTYIAYPTIGHQAADNKRRTSLSEGVLEQVAVWRHSNLQSTPRAQNTEARTLLA